MDLLIADKAFLVVGGTSGIGFAAARSLAADGASVLIVGRDEEKAQAAAAGLAEGGSRVVPASVDVAKPDGADEADASALAAFGRIDGVAVTTGLIGHEPIDISDERWMEVVSDVLLGTTRTIQAALPHLIDARGTIVTTAAYSIRAPEIARLPYAAMKSAVATFTKGIANAYGKHGVRANCIAPGAIETAALTSIRANIAKERNLPYEEALEMVMIDDWGLDIALRRPGRPEEVGELIAFLLSPRAGYLTGALVNIDGGTNF